MIKRFLPFLLLLPLFVPAASLAATPGAALTISADASPSVFSPEHNGTPRFDSYTVTVTNSGSEPTAAGATIAIQDTLPPGVIATSIEGAEFQQEPPTLPCVLATVTCTYSGALQPGDTLRVNIQVEIGPKIQSEVEGGGRVAVRNAATASGGGVAPVSTVAENEVATAQASREEPFGVQRFSTTLTTANGLADTQAGDHPFELTSSALFNTADLDPAGFSPFSRVTALAGGVGGVEGQLKDVVLDLPPGLLGDPQVVPKCPQYKVGNTSSSHVYSCPRESQIGVADIYLSATTLAGASRTALGTSLESLQVVPIFNVVPDQGYPAEFALEVAEKTVPIYVNVNAETGYGVRALVKDIPPVGGTVGFATTFFGAPVTNPDVNNATRPPGSEPVAFLDNSTDCSAGPQDSTIYADTWQHPGAWLVNGSPDLADPNWKSATAVTYPSLTGCDMLQFFPALEVLPSTTQADEPSALSVHLRVPQAQQEAGKLVTPPLKDASVTLPAGFSVSPSGADGLQACTDTPEPGRPEGEIALHSIVAGECPRASVLGTVKILTPLLDVPLEGQVFLGQPECDPCNAADAADGREFRLFLQATGAGVTIKQEGVVDANPATGQLTATFKNAPPAPASDIEVRFKSGLRAPLATPQTCGTYTTSADLTPWSAPVTPDADLVSQFNIDWDGNGGACPATLPFSPSFSAGMSNPDAGQFSPFTLTFGREDREQDLAGIQVHMPPGLLGSIATVPLCPEPQSSLGTCPEASRIGGMTVAAGPGSHPLYERGSIYLTGPYEGAPFGLSIVVPTVAGPFNLGNVVVRAKIDVDPSTAALTVTSDPFPQVIDGVPLRLRTANVTIDRPGFIFNPTTCAQLHITATITAAQGAQANVSAPFAVSGCAGLHFGPTFKVSTSGRTSRADGASLDAQLTFPAGAQSNIAKVKVDLPKQLPSRLTTLQRACSAVTFDANPAACPTASVVGIAKAVTPVLPVPLVGPAYFVSHGGEAFPQLVVVLQGYGVTVDLVGDTFISKQGITSSTFENVPDVQVSSFELYLPEGKYSALASNGDLCTSKLELPTLFTAQDGAQLKQDTRVKVSDCPKARKAKRAKLGRGRKAVSARRSTS